MDTSELEHTYEELNIVETCLIRFWGKWSARAVVRNGSDLTTFVVEHKPTIHEALLELMEEIKKNRNVTES